MPKAIKRFDFINGRLMESETGEFVRFKDYEELYAKYISSTQSDMFEPIRNPDMGKPIVSTIIKSPLQRRIESLFRRKSTRAWDIYEKRAFKNNINVIRSTTEQEWQLLEEFYRLPFELTYKRKVMSSLLNNWNGEIDKAMQYFRERSSNYSGSKAISAKEEDARLGRV